MCIFIFIVAESVIVVFLKLKIYHRLLTAFIQTAVALLISSAVIFLGHSTVEALSVFSAKANNAARMKERLARHGM